MTTKTLISGLNTYCRPTWKAMIDSRFTLRPFTESPRTGDLVAYLDYSLPQGGTYTAGVAIDKRDLSMANLEKIIDTLHAQILLANDELKAVADKEEQG